MTMSLLFSLKYKAGFLFPNNFNSLDVFNISSSWVFLGFFCKGLNEGVDLGFI